MIDQGEGYRVKELGGEGGGRLCHVSALGVPAKRIGLLSMLGRMGLSVP